MIINKTVIRDLEHKFRRSFPADLKKYLLVNYANEPFPYEFTEQDLYANIQKDIHDYEAGTLDVTVKSPSERWAEEREYLQDLCIEKFREICILKEYISELEHKLLEHGLEPSQMVKQRVKYEAESLPY
ncbi:hypothetical protein Desaci_2592 [Desulfosporosinus acidiphilus SJ4]|uniref:Uncharacterized protein n=1 Tax=Desulfosporosinus acidiphilus (strain DSM 22704 / JCM 16185 / SJ4) TaxID=646529 RepID=I4D6V3_DESAJ|nr:hypothetical protein [Desulfosporosinus acidiphilus]AFM41527.1 hypothetical protein Desaci_2592 [Desulfosporosinus acidiphilus SJ4]